MTKAVPPRCLPLSKRDGNQEDAHAPEPSSRSSKLFYFPLQQQQSPDWDEDAKTTRDTYRLTSLVDLLDLELDLVLPATATPAPMSNQLATSAPREEELETDIDDVSLELLVSTKDNHTDSLTTAHPQSDIMLQQAMQSPHGERENQQWQEEQNMNAIPSPAPVRPEHSPRRKMNKTSAAMKPMSLNIVSPTAFVLSFPPSSTQSCTDDDYGLASPMALPDTPSQTRPGITLAWDLEPTSPTFEVVRTRGEDFCRRAQSKSVQRPERRASAVSLAARSATPNPRSYRNCVPETATPRRTRSSLSTLPEVRGKARHGGIYSLLLKNKSVKQEPVLIEDAHNPEQLAAPSVSKISPPRSFGKQKHGGIYKMLRTSHGPR